MPIASRSTSSPNRCRCGAHDVPIVRRDPYSRNKKRWKILIAGAICKPSYMAAKHEEKLTSGGHSWQRRWQCPSVCRCGPVRVLVLRKHSGFCRIYRSFFDSNSRLHLGHVPINLIWVWQGLLQGLLQGNMPTEPCPVSTGMVPELVAVNATTQPSHTAGTKKQAVASASCDEHTSR